MAPVGTLIPAGSPQASRRSLDLVGLGRLELPTSRLSSARSNQLSYKPETVISDPLPASGEPSHRNKTADGAPQLGNRSPAPVRLRRKRNEDGGVPPNGPVISGP